MIFVPLSFCATLLLVVLLARMLHDGDSERRGWLFEGVVALYAVQTLLVGLRWGYGISAVTSVMPLLASLVPPASYLAFRSLTRESAAFAAVDLLHLGPTILLAVMMLVLRGGVDALIIVEFLGYGLALLHLTRGGADRLVAARLDGSIRSLRAMQLCAAVLIASALSDLAISLDFTLSGGVHAGALVSLSTTLVLIFLGLAAATARSAAGTDEGQGMESAAEPSRNEAPAAVEPRANADDQAEWQAILTELDALMDKHRLFADSSLNLARLARRLSRPARAVSNAVNRLRGTSVSQYVNDFRVAEACRLLRDTQEPVTRILYDAGFMTKSNFNREFSRVTGMTPSDWRAENAAGNEPLLQKTVLRSRALV